MSPSCAVDGGGKLCIMHKGQVVSICPVLYQSTIFICLSIVPSNTVALEVTYNLDAAVGNLTRKIEGCNWWLVNRAYRDSCDVNG